jgi:hypothetical protein
MAEHDNILVTGPYIAYQSVGTQFIGGKHTHNYPAPDTGSSTDRRIVEDIEFEDVSTTGVSPEITVPPMDKESHSGSSDTSFFTSRFPEDTTVKNIREAIDFASSKADACRRIMALETQGYIILSNVSDDRKAELINPYAQPKFTLTGEDFKKARNNPPKKK